MLRDRYGKDKRFAEILQEFPEMDRELAIMDACLSDEQIFETVRRDLAKRWPQTLVNGRPSTPVEVGLRMLVVKRMYNWSYAETEYHVRDSLILRQFCRIYLNRVPDDTTLIRWNKVIRPETLVQFNERITQIAFERKVTKGEKLRTDGTVVLTNIHAPADNRLLVDGVRVLSRSIVRGRERLTKLGQAVHETFVDATREAVQFSRQIGQVLRKHSEATYEKGKELYRELITGTEQALQAGQQTLTQLRAQADDRVAGRLAQTLETFLPRVAQVIEQTERRIFQQEQVPAGEKIVSLFEPHSDILVNTHKTPSVEFGHKVWLNEVDGGIVSHYHILDGNPADTGQWLPALADHRATFGHPPRQASADRGLFSADNEDQAKQQGIEQVILPKNGGRSKKRIAYEHEDWFVEGRHWHAGVEGRISFLKRRFGLECCLAHGRPGFERWIGWGVIAHNLVNIGRAVAKKERNQ